MLEISITGVGEAVRRLEQLEANAKRLDGEHEVAVDELFTPEFMGRYSSVLTFDALIKAGGFKVASREDFRAIPDDEWDLVVQRHTSFGSWRDMKKKAAEEYFRRELTSGL